MKVQFNDANTLTMEYKRPPAQLTIL